MFHTHIRAQCSTIEIYDRLYHTQLQTMQTTYEYATTYRNSDAFNKQQQLTQCYVPPPPRVNMTIKLIARGKYK